MSRVLALAVVAVLGCKKDEAKPAEPDPDPVVDTDTAQGDVDLPQVQCRVDGQEPTLALSSESEAIEAFTLAMGNDTFESLLVTKLWDTFSTVGCLTVTDGGWTNRRIEGDCTEGDKTWRGTFTTNAAGWAFDGVEASIAGEYDLQLDGAIKGGSAGAGTAYLTNLTADLVIASHSSLGVEMDQAWRRDVALLYDETNGADVAFGYLTAAVVLGRVEPQSDLSPGSYCVFLDDPSVLVQGKNTAILGRAGCDDYFELDGEIVTDCP